MGHCSLCVLPPELTILNGSSPHTASGDFTYISVHENSVVDYWITLFDLLELCFNLKVGENILSSHLPIEAIYHVTSIAGVHITKNPNFDPILTFSYFHYKKLGDPNFL